MIILRLLLLLTNLHLKLLCTQGTGADKLLSTQRVKVHSNHNKLLYQIHDNDITTMLWMNGCNVDGRKVGHFLITIQKSFKLIINQS